MHRVGARGVNRATHPFSTGGVYVNFLTGEETDRVQAAYGANHDRLRAAQGAGFDPDKPLPHETRISVPAPRRQQPPCSACAVLFYVCRPERAGEHGGHPGRIRTVPARAEA